MTEIDSSPIPKDRTEIDIFGYKIIINKIPKKFFQTNELSNSLDVLFNSEIVLSMGGNSEEQRGKSYSTCSFSNDILLELEGINPLIKYITNIILKEHNITNVNYKYRGVTFDRAWANKMFKGCSGACHTHNGSNDGTAIFYFSVPKNGSNLIILEHPIEDVVNENHKNISHFIPVKTGDLILHGKNVPHAVSEHLSETPRICFVFDYSLF
jgi:hypothetical protein